MLNFSQVGKYERHALAVKFLTDMGVDTETLNDGHEITRDNFDLWIIDNQMADDPGDARPGSSTIKGFGIQRNEARLRLNRWGEKLPADRAFAIETVKGTTGLYQVVTWRDNAVALAQGVGNQVHSFARAKMKRLSTMRLIAQEKAGDSAEYLEAERMMATLEGYSAVMERNIKAEVDKYNTATMLVESKIKEAARIGTDGE